MNARGNSVLFFSQIFRGFMDALTIEADEININEIKEAFKLATERVYSGVSIPVEGTILTVIRVISEQLQTTEFENMQALFAFAYQIAQETLEKTPEMLPALKEVGVVDSVDKWFSDFFNGMNEQLNNRLMLMRYKVKIRHCN